MEDFIEHLSIQLGSKIETVRSVSGGDISAAYLIETSSERYFLKVNSNPTAMAMFISEENALNAIAKTNTIASPKVLACNSYKNNSYLIMEFIEAKSHSQRDLDLLGIQLAHLHNVTCEQFGLDHNNFIGKLHQSNKKHQNWNDFYIEERLKPQLELARSKGLLRDSEIPNTELMKTTCFPYFKNIKPSLLHGDLWSGNYLISTDGKPYLIDPAIYFGHHEVDIAMSKLFGGFGSSFYSAYRKVFPEDAFSKDRIQLYQLYYLLVHLNMFGSSYYSSVKQIMANYF